MIGHFPELSNLSLAQDRFHHFHKLAAYAHAQSRFERLVFCAVTADSVALELGFNISNSSYLIVRGPKDMETLMVCIPLFLLSSLCPMMFVLLL